MDKIENKYTIRFEELVEEELDLEAALYAIEIINREICENAENFDNDEKKDVIDFVDWFYRKKNDSDFEKALLEKFNYEYPKMFQLAADYTLDNDVKMAEHILTHAEEEEQQFIRKVLDYFFSFDMYCEWNFWCGKDGYFETAIPERKNIKPDRLEYMKKVVKVWVCRVINLGGTIMFRRTEKDGTIVVNGFVARKEQFGAIRPEALKEALLNNSDMPKEMIEKMQFEAYMQ